MVKIPFTGFSGRPFVFVIHSTATRNRQPQSATIAPMNGENIAENIQSIRQRVRLAAEKCQRRPDEVAILAVSKTRSAEELRSASQNGLSAFGENYLQEALEKIEALADLPLTWHFIGPIQSNKTRAIASHFQWAHSVERLKIARRLSEQRPADLQPLQICLQVNVSGEASKSGASLAELPQLAREVAQLPGIALRGLMAIPAATDDVAKQRQAFATLRNALDSLRNGPTAIDAPLDTLSMGMSGDMEAAIAEGATIVRIGTAIFGARS
jgi:PLP dependent protein